VQGASSNKRHRKKSKALWPGWSVGLRSMPRSSLFLVGNLAHLGGWRSSPYLHTHMWLGSWDGCGRWMYWEKGKAGSVLVGRFDPNKESPKTALWLFLSK
jgi:hypothetical protein